MIRNMLLPVDAVLQLFGTGKVADYAGLIHPKNGNQDGTQLTIYRTEKVGKLLKSQPWNPVAVSSPKLPSNTSEIVSVLRKTNELDFVGINEKGELKTICRNEAIVKNLEGQSEFAAREE